MANEGMCNDVVARLGCRCGSMTGVGGIDLEIVQEARKNECERNRMRENLYFSMKGKGVYSRWGICLITGVGE